MHVKLLTATSIVALALAGANAQAQTIDYGSLEQLFGEPVTNSATGSPQKASDAPVDMIIVTQDDIRRSGANDIPGVLAHVPGVNVLEFSTDDSEVSVRGYDQTLTPRLLVLVDGRQVYLDYRGVTVWSAIPVELSEIRQIEIVKGPNNALFGFNAVGGVINIVTYNPLYDDVNTASITGGTQGLIQGSAVGTFKLGDIGAFRIATGAHVDNDFSTPLEIGSQGVRRGNNSGKMDINGVFRLGDNVQATIDLSHSEADQDADSTNFYYEYYRYGMDSAKVQINADTAYGALQGSLYSNWSRAEPTAGRNQTPTFDFVNQVTVAQLQDLFKLGTDHTFRVSLEYRYNTDSVSPIGNANVHYDVLSAGGMWDWKIDPTLAVTNAIRIDDLDLGRAGYTPPNYPYTNAFWDRTFVEPSFNSGVVWQPTDDDTIRLTSARGIQMPSLSQLGARLSQPTPTSFSGGLPTVNPSVVMNYGLSWDRSVPWIDGKAGVNLYYQTNDALSTQYGQITFIGKDKFTSSANVGNSDALGLELSVSGKFLEDWRWGLSYTPETITDHFTLPFATEGAAFQEHTPTNIVKANLGWAHGPWEVDGYATYESRFYGIAQPYAFIVPSGIGKPQVTLISDYVALDGRIAYKVTDWATLALSAKNFSQGAQRQTAGADVERQVFATFSVNF